jgi:hypothetical protein
LTLTLPPILREILKAWWLQVFSLRAFIEESAFRTQPGQFVLARATLPSMSGR